jgi:hypothetical protein
MLKQYFTEQQYSHETPLCKIMFEYGSDKSPLKQAHNYTTLYYFLFKDLVEKPVNVFECGLGTNNPNVQSSMNGRGAPGGSLKGWKKFFPKGNIFGADIDKDILFQEDNIKTFYCDQRNLNTVEQMLQDDSLVNISFDIIIDDGLHDVNYNIPYLGVMFDKLKDGGYYIIEDIAVRHNQEAIATKFVNDNKYNFTFIDYIKIPYPPNVGDNNIILIKK